MGKKVKALRDEINRLVAHNNILKCERRDNEEAILSYKIAYENLKKQVIYFEKVLELSKDSKILIVNELTKDNIKEYLKGE